MRLRRAWALVALGTVAAPLANAAATLSPGWPEVTQTAHPWIRWWWPGSAVDEANLTAELESFQTAGLGGVEITPIYGARGAEERYVAYLSPRWVELLQHTGAEANRLGLGVDMATGTGWPFGGPWVPVEDGAQALTVQAGQWAMEPTKQQVKRAAPGGEGTVLDPYSPDALERYLSHFDEALIGFPDELVRSQFHDSFEYYGANVTGAFADAFERQHGYRIEPYAAEVLSENPTTAPDKLARIKRDYRATLDHLHQSYLQQWADWAHGHGWKTRNQSHGAPANLLDLYGIADIPETETFGSTPFPIPGLRREPDRIGKDVPEPLVTRFASSAGHVMGKPLISSETATWLREHWHVTLAGVKPEVDRLFLDGINHVFYHGAVFSPADAQWPGWLFYASTQFNPRNPWWEDFGALNAYVARVQSVLQSGQPDNDLLVYWPLDDLWHSPDGLQQLLSVHRPEFATGTAFGETTRQLREHGHSFDYISDAQLRLSHAEDGRIVTPGTSYAALVVPPVQHMRLETLRALLELAEGGATVIMQGWPEDVPGLGRLKERRAELKDLRQPLKFQHDRQLGVDVAKVGRGRVLLDEDALSALPRLPGVRPEAMHAQGLESIRRRTTDGWDYFIANLGAEPREGWFPLGVEASTSTLLDPLTGRGGVAAMRQTPNATEAYLQLAPGESLILRTVADGKSSGPAWPYTEPAQPVQTLPGPWRVKFVNGGSILPDPFATDQPVSWTTAPGADAERFSGTARYSTTFELDPTIADGWQLDLGDVRESARVWVNGQLVGTAWSLPYRLLLDGDLRAGTNELAIEVTNTAANRIRDLDRRSVDWKIMREINFVNIHYRPFDASGWPVQPAGLLGPVKLVPLERVEVK
ncbi:MAG: glycosyl hydrolase [Verrucomicrobiota bacterium JB022]|nr:glycosyl hydrolase [Verrucomicrobiota bacterium JB022]